MRQDAKTDTNHAEIRTATRKAGYFWFDTFQLGKGFPDALVVSKSGITILIEVKSKGGKLTRDEAEFVRDYPGLMVVVYSAEELLDHLRRWDLVQLPQTIGW